MEHINSKSTYQWTKCDLEEIELDKDYTIPEVCKSFYGHSVH